MSLSFEEIQRLQRPERESARQSHIEQLQARASVGQKISELQADPRWEVLGRHIEALMDQERERRRMTEFHLVNSILTGDAYLTAKVKHAKADGAFHAYNQVMQLAKVLIEQGESALKELNSLTSEEKSA